MDIEFLIERFEQYLLEDCPKIPFSGSRAVSEDEVCNHLAQLRAAIPEEIARARKIMDREDVLLQQARRQAEQIIADAEAEAERLAAEHRIVKQAEEQAAAIRAQAHQEARELRVEADEYAFDELSKLEAELKRSLRVVENGLKKLETEHEERLEG